MENNLSGRGKWIHSSQMFGNHKEVLKINVSKKVTINLSVPHSEHT